MNAATAIITKKRNGLNSRATTRLDNHAQFSVARSNDPSRLVSAMMRSCATFDSLF
jgi:hypothetical protein